MVEILLHILNTIRKSIYLIPSIPSYNWKFPLYAVYTVNCMCVHMFALLSYTLRAEIERNNDWKDETQSVILFPFFAPLWGNCIREAAKSYFFQFLCSFSRNAVILLKRKIMIVDFILMFDFSKNVTYS